MKKNKYYTLSPKTNQRVLKIVMRRVDVSEELKQLKREAFKNRNGFEPEIKKTWKPVINADPAQILKEVFASEGGETVKTIDIDKENSPAMESAMEEVEICNPVVAAATESPFIYTERKDEKVNPLTGFPESFDVGLFQPPNDDSSVASKSELLIRCSYCDKMDTKQNIWQHTIMEHSKH